jgi:hypothetical protein
MASYCRNTEVPGYLGASQLNAYRIRVDANGPNPLYFALEQSSSSATEWVKDDRRFLDAEFRNRGADDVSLKCERKGVALV